ncbi:4Fe-4S dicluster domain-containing protein [Candidatus Omnitrophota bacterium]
MPKVEINKEKCKGCQLCLIYCPKTCIKVDGAINRKGINPVFFSNKDDCTGCSFCAIVCPETCVTVYK